MQRIDFIARVRACERRLYRIARTMLSCDADCEDAVQETLLKAWAGRDGLRNEAYFETWLIRILINECHNIQRSNRKCMPQEKFREEAYMPDEYADLREAVQQLDESLRLPVVLHYIAGYDTKESARILRIPHGTLCTRLKRARQHMKEFLKNA